MIEHGFYTEAFLVAFSVLDDFVQQTLHQVLVAKGLKGQGDRNELLRGIKENRLRLYLGPVLKIAFGKDIDEMWPKATTVVKWLNTKRNRIAHSAESADYATAVRGVYGCLKLLVVLRDGGVAPDLDLTPWLFRHAKHTASWTIDAPDWIPRGEVAGSVDFRS